MNNELADCIGFMTTEATDSSGADEVLEQTTDSSGADEALEQTTEAG